MRKLRLTFLTEDGRTSILQPAYANQNLDATQVREFMDQIVALDLFQKDGLKKYVQPVSAKYVETNITELF